jgi:hypothetical protein
MATVKTIEDELRETNARVQAIVATAEAAGRDLSPEEDIETRTLLQKMRALDTKRQVRGNGFDDVLRNVRTTGDAPRAAWTPSGESLGAQLVRSDVFQNFRASVGHGRPTSMMPLEIRAATPYLPPGTSYAPATVAPPPAGPLPPWGQASVSSLFPALPAQGGSVSYLRDVRTGLEPGIPATGTPPGTAKPETPVSPTLIEQALVTLATWSKISNTVPEDVAGFQAWIDSVLTAGIYDAEAAYIIATILGVAGILTVTPAAGAPVADALLDAAMQVQSRSDLPATGAIVAPDVFTALATAKASTSGVYLSGLPLSAPPALTLWGQLSIVVSSAMAAGSALVVAGRAGATYRKGALRVDISDSDGSDFLSNLLTIRIEERVAFAVYRAVGFASVSGLVVTP